MPFPARNRAENLLRRIFPKRSEAKRSSGLRLVRGVPLMAAIQQDRIVRDQLGRGHLSLDAVRTAWYHMRDHEDARALWRILADVQSVDSDELFREAAEAYGYQAANVSMLGTAILVDGNRRSFSTNTWTDLIRLGVFPVREKNDPLDYGVRWVFASYDPARPIVRQFLSTRTNHAFQVRYLDPQTLFQLVEACFDVEEVDGLLWHRRYVLGRKPIPLVVSLEEELGRAA